jgi:hypothetical protein
MVPFLHSLEQNEDCNTIEGGKQTSQSEGLYVTPVHRMSYPHFSQQSVKERYGQDKTSPAADACVVSCEKLIAILPNLPTISLFIYQGLARIIGGDARGKH